MSDLLLVSINTFTGLSSDVTIDYKGRFLTCRYGSGAESGWSVCAVPKAYCVLVFQYALPDLRSRLGWGVIYGAVYCVSGLGRNIQ